MIPAAKVHIPKDDIDAILAMIEGALTTGQLTSSTLTKQFEQEFSAYHHGLHSVAVSSGTSALEIILRSYQVAGKEVIVPSNTFIATAAAVAHAGGTPVVVDIDPDTLALSPEAVEAAITPRTAGVIVVHIGGIVTHQIAGLQAITKRHGLFLVEDCAHAHGSAFKGQLAGTFGDAAAFSFFPTKVMTSGEGGMILTKSESLVADALIYRDQGKANAQTNLHVRLGSNWRLSELHAAVGLTQLRRLQEFIAYRQSVAAYYGEALADIPAVRLQPIHPDCLCNYYKYIVLLEDGIDRDRIKQLMREQGVSPSGEVYTVPVHKQPIAAAWPSHACPAAEQFANQHLCLPLWVNMQQQEQTTVVQALRHAIQHSKKEGAACG